MDDRHARHRRTDADRRRRPSDGHRSADRSRFSRLVHDAAEGLPPALRAELERVELVVRDVPTEGADVSRLEPAVSGDPTSPGSGPDRLTLFRRALELRATSKLDLVELVREALAAALADRLGIDDDGSDDGPRW